MTLRPLLLIPLLAGCPRHPGGPPVDTDVIDTEVVDTVVDTAAHTDVDTDTDGPDTDTAAPTSCDAAAATLAEELYAVTGSCTVTVRLDHDRTTLLGWQALCGRYASVDEDAARATAFADAGWASSADAGVTLDKAPEDAWVFYDSPGDFGGAAAVSARTGLAVFGGTIVWDGRGDLTYPATWRDSSLLASGCDGAAPPSARGFDLAAGGEALSEADVDAALALVRDTALPAAFQRGGYLFDAVVLRYPRSVGAFDPSTAEWIVLLNGGWLE